MWLAEKVERIARAFIWLGFAAKKKWGFAGDIYIGRYLHHRTLFNYALDR